MLKDQSKTIRMYALSFFKDSACAIWTQNIIIVLSVLVAFLSLRDTDENLKKANSLAFMQRFYLDKPPLSVESIHLRAMQYNVVQEAKKLIPGYNQEANRAAGWGQLFERARPLVLETIRNDPKLVASYEEVSNFFLSAIACTRSNVCDQQSMVSLISHDMLAFYNAVCPYMEDQEIAFNHEDESPIYLDFLVNSSNMKNSYDYFCRDKLGKFLAEKP